MTVSQSQQVFTINSIVKNLAEKGIRFMLHTNYKDSTIKLIGVEVTKKGKFFRINGKIFGHQIANYTNSLTTPVRLTKEQIEALNN